MCEEAIRTRVQPSWTDEVENSGLHNRKRQAEEKGWELRGGGHSALLRKLAPFPKESEVLLGQDASF